MTDDCLQGALLIGAAGGIGRCVAELFRSRGIPVTGIDLAESPFADRPDYRHVRTDMAQTGSVDAVLDAIRGRPPCYVINVAGGAVAEEVAKAPHGGFAVETLERTMWSNLRTSLSAISIAEALAAESGGRNVSVTLCSSVNAVGNYQYPVYSASKGAVESLVRTESVPLGRKGIRINAIRLGTVVTETSTRLHGDTGNEHYEALLRLTALGRFVTVTEAAAAFVAAAADITGMTGAVITVDAGQSVPGGRD
jgi:NAD(P)-dependent dehydrogenase (short-subunit alcohol dehydrogenase family)